MNYSLIRAIYQDTWAVSPQYFNQYYPIAQSITRGLQFELEPESKDSHQFYYNPANSSRLDAKEKKDEGGLIAVTPLVGVMLKYDTACGPRGTVTIAKRLKAADNDPAVDGHILMIDSGGGQTSAVNPLAETIQELTKPIIAFVDGAMASAALFVGSYCKEVIAGHDMHMIGSVGTMIALDGFASGEKDPEGVKHIRIYSSTSPEKNKEFEEALNNDNFEVMQKNILDPLDDNFMTEVKKNRQNVSEKDLEGGIVFAKDTVGSFIDSIGNLNHAVERLSIIIENSKNQSNMSRPNLTALARVAGVGSFENTQEGVHLSLDIATAVNAALERLDAAEAAIKGLPEGQTVQTILDQNSKLEKKNKELNEENEQLSKEPGAEETTAHSKGDKQDDSGEPAFVDTEAEAYYEIYKQNNPDK